MAIRYGPSKFLKHLRVDVGKSEINQRIKKLQNQVVRHRDAEITHNIESFYYCTPNKNIVQIG
jgi:hypothetical protein